MIRIRLINGPEEGREFECAYGAGMNLIANGQAVAVVSEYQKGISIAPKNKAKGSSPSNKRKKRRR